MHATVIKLNPLPYPVRTASKYDDFLFVGRNGFILFVKSRIIVRCLCFELSSACVYQFVHALDPHLMTFFEDFAFPTAEQMCNLPVSISFLLCFHHQLTWNCGDVI